jgi:putative oxidoreductase
MTENSFPLKSTAPAGRSKSKTVNIVAWALQGLVALAFLAAGSAKLACAPPMVDLFAKIGIGQWFRYLTGTLEVLSALGLLIPRVTFFAALTLCAIMICAIIAHLAIIGGNPAPAIVLLVLSGTIVYLRRN